MAAAMMNVTITGDHRSTQRMLASVEELLSPVGMGPFFKTKVEPWIKVRARDRFRTEGDDVSGPWEALREATREIREGQGFPGAHPINRRTGELERYIVGSEGSIAFEGVMSVFTYPGTLPTGYLETKVRTAQAGKKEPRTVARPVLGIGTRDMMFILGMLVTHVRRAS